MTSITIELSIEIIVHFPGVLFTIDTSMLLIFYNFYTACNLTLRSSDINFDFSILLSAVVKEILHDCDYQAPHLVVLELSQCNHTLPSTYSTCDKPRPHAQEPSYFWALTLLNFCNFSEVGLCINLPRISEARE